jgi:hypothetical protein
MVRSYKPGNDKPSPSGLACRGCGATTSSGRRGHDSRLCARRRCSEKAADEARAAACGLCEEQLALAPTNGAPFAIAVMMPSAAVITVTAMPLAAPVPGMPMAAPPIAMATTAAAAPAVEPKAAEPKAAPGKPPTPLPSAQLAPLPLRAVDGNAQRKRARAADAPSEPSAYELERLANVERNINGVLRELGLLNEQPEPPPRRPRGLPKPPPPTSRRMRSATSAPAAAATHPADPDPPEVDEPSAVSEPPSAAGAAPSAEERCVDASLGSGATSAAAAAEERASAVRMAARSAAEARAALVDERMLRARVLPLLPKVGDECSVEKVEKATGLSFHDIDVALGQKLMILSSYGARNGSGTFTRYE